MISLALRQWPCPAMLAFHRPRRWLLVAALLAIAGCSEGGAGRTVAVAAEPSADSQAGENELAQAPGKPAGKKKPKSAAQAPRKGPAKAGDEELEFPYKNRIPSPELTGGVGWINTAGPLELADLKGKFVLLDFWTYCCINCMHILPELKKLEKAYPNELVVIGVHSAKFDGEQDSKNIADAVQRYDIEHPVVNDAQHAIWDRFGVQSWPTMILIDPEGDVVWGNSGEVEFRMLDAVIKLGLPYFRQKGLLDETPLRFDLEAHKAKRTPLRFPGKILADEAGERLFVADSNHHRIVIAKLDGTLVDVIGSGSLGAEDGDFAAASFNHPQGMALKDQTLYVADTENHLLRKIDLEAKQVATIAGVGEQGRMAWPGLDAAQRGEGGKFETPARFVGPPRKTPINSPWDLWIHGDDLYIAMAGPHQIWKMPLDESEIGPYAGNGREDIVDGPLLPPQPYEDGYSAFAQPSGLTSDGKQLFVADSEGSSIRAVPFDPAGKVKTVIGTSHLARGRLFHFGDADGQGKKVLLQHALGVAYYRGQLYVADTYNNKLKVIDPKKATCRTLAGSGEPGAEDDPAEFDEPAGLSAAAGKLYVADTNNHLVRVVDLDRDNRVSTLELTGLEPPAPPQPAPLAPNKDAQQVAAPPAELKPEQGAVRLAVELELPEGYKINALAPMGYQVEAVDAEGPIDRQSLGKPVRLKEPKARFEIELPVAADAGEDELKVTLNYYYCQDGGEGLCKVGTVVWTVPVKLDGNAKRSSAPLKLKVE
jgi:thiol-disulfide isomerase/thioredoxin